MKEIDTVIEEVSAKFGYSETLTNDLKRIVPIMLEGKDDEKKQMFFDMLSETRIFVLPFNASIDDLEACKKQVFGNDNENVTFTAANLGEYSKTEMSDGAYISEPIFDDDMNIVGRNRMLFVKELSNWDSIRKAYGSDINISHLIHELGHAWAAEKDEYVQNEDGSFAQNIGAASITHDVDKATKQVKELGADGLFIEEALNTMQEEQAILKITGARSIDELSSKGYVISSYQGLFKRIMESYVEKFGAEKFEEYRFSKDGAAIADIEAALAKTPSWSTLMTDEYTEARRKRVSLTDNLEVSEETKTRIRQFFKDYNDVYFPDNNQFTPIQKLNNVLEQIYDFSAIKYGFNVLNNQNNLEIYKKISSLTYVEASALRNEAVIEAKVSEEKSTDLMDLKKEVKDDKSVEEYYIASEEQQKKENTRQINEESR